MLLVKILEFDKIEGGKNHRPSVRSPIHTIKVSGNCSGDYQFKIETSMFVHGMAIIIEREINWTPVGVLAYLLSRDKGF